VDVTLESVLELGTYIWNFRSKNIFALTKIQNVELLFLQDLVLQLSKHKLMHKNHESASDEAKVKQTY